MTVEIKVYVVALQALNRLAKFVEERHLAEVCDGCDGAGAFEGEDCFRCDGWGFLANPEEYKTLQAQRFEANRERNEAANRADRLARELGEARELIARQDKSIGVLETQLAEARAEVSYWPDLKRTLREREWVQRQLAEAENERDAAQHQHRVEVNLYRELREALGLRGDTGHPAVLRRASELIHDRDVARKELLDVREKLINAANAAVAERDEARERVRHWRSWAAAVLGQTLTHEDCDGNIRSKIDLRLSRGGAARAEIDEARARLETVRREAAELREELKTTTSMRLRESHEARMLLNRWRSWARGYKQHKSELRELLGEVDE